MTQKRMLATRKMFAAAMGLGLTLISTRAWAHPGHGEHDAGHAWWEGVLHPVLQWDYLAVLLVGLGVGVVISRVSWRHRRAARRRA